jgi:hypothetical protein
MPIDAGFWRSKPVPEIRMHVMGCSFAGRDVLPPRRRHALRTAPRDLNNKSAAATVKLNGKQVDTPIVRSPKMGKSSLESQFADRGNEN